MYTYTNIHAGAICMYICKQDHRVIVCCPILSSPKYNCLNFHHIHTYNAYMTGIHACKKENPPTWSLMCQSITSRSFIANSLSFLRRKCAIILSWYMHIHAYIYIFHVHICMYARMSECMHRSFMPDSPSCPRRSCQLSCDHICTCMRAYSMYVLCM